MSLIDPGTGRPIKNQSTQHLEQMFFELFQRLKMMETQVQALGGSLFTTQMFVEYIQNKLNETHGEDFLKTEEIFDWIAVRQQELKAEYEEALKNMEQTRSDATEVLDLTETNLTQKEQ